MLGKIEDCRGPASPESRDTLRMNSIGERMTRGDQASVSKARNFIFKRSFYNPDLYIEENERCKVMQSQLKHSSSFALIGTRIFFSAYLSINKGLMLCTLSFGLGGPLTFYDPFLIKIGQLKHLLSLEMVFS